MNHNKYSGVGEIFKLLQEKIYSITPDINSTFSYKDKIIARREKIEVTQHSVYKTQFINEKLKFAISPFTETTKVIYYHNDTELNTVTFRPRLDQNYASIICEVEPVNTITHVSVVLYEGYLIEDILLSDGSVQMKDFYNPTKPKDIVTKDYVDDIVEDLVAGEHPLRSFEIVQGDYGPLIGYYYRDNSIHDKILLLRENETRISVEDCTLKLRPFVVSNSFDKDTTQIALIVNGNQCHVEYIKNILQNTSTDWKLLASENIYTVTQVDEVYWKNTYQLTFNLKQFESEMRPAFTFQVRIWDNKAHEKLSQVFTYEIDENIIKLRDKDIEISYIEENLKKYFTKYVSGIAYLPEDESVEYSLPVTVKVKNKFLQYYRGKKCLELLVVNSKGSNIVYNLPISQHQNLSGEFEFHQDIKFNINTEKLQVRVYNLKGTCIATKDLILTLRADSSDESNRVTTPPGDILYPSTGYGEKWDSTKQLEPWEMKLQKGKYFCSDKNNSAVCFVYEPKDDYSHIKLDIEHDGLLQILSEGNTGWLNCQGNANMFVNPTQHGDGCLVQGLTPSLSINDKHFTFGKVVYKSRVFIRIIRATQVKINAVTIE